MCKTRFYPFPPHAAASSSFLVHMHDLVYSTIANVGMGARRRSGRGKTAFLCLWLNGSG